MLVHQENPATPLTPVSTPDVQHSELSPRSTNSSFASTDSLTHESSPNSTPKETANTENNQGLSALQRLEFALERNSLFSALLHKSEEGSEGRTATTARLVKPCPSSTSSCTSDSPNAKHDNNSSDHSETGMKTHTPASSPDDGTNPTNIIFQCPLCSMVCNSRHEFNEHLVTHSQQHACPKCTFLTDNEDTLKEHVAEIHDVSDYEEMLMTDDEVRTPKTNSQGKVKTFKCKQCGHHAVTKMEFWDHTKTHIRSEKMLTCPKCPFVTEYKHHLEYHLRNHYGSKPFQCNKCPYSCVNKSMLNSHLKSHSNIYQYRCADCSYATKYCHSLKLHLRKYNHKPAMVLNPDGTPNPLPIIDVYGTRRGPKIKRSSDQTLTETNQGLLSPPQLVREKTPKSNRNAKRSTQERREKSDFPRTPPASPRYRDHEIKQETIHTLSNGPQTSPREESIRLERNNVANLEFVRNSNNNIMLQHVQQQNTMPVPGLMGSLNPAAIQGLLMSNSARSQGVNPVTAMALQSLLLQNSANQAAIDLVKNPAHLYAAAAFGQYLLGNPSLHNSSPMEIVQSVEDQQRSNMIAQLIQRQQHQETLSPRVSSVPIVSSPPPLNMGTVRDMDATTHSPLDLRNPRGSSDFSRHKRKGKAIRYENHRSPQETSTSNDSEEVLDFSSSNTSANREEMKKVVMNVKKEISAEESRVCKYCDISFPPVLYDLHMPFHSNDADPFRCDKCGAATKDKVGFFIHLATASH